MGRKKIEIKKIEDQRARIVCFSKRRKGLFKKAEEFSRLYNVDIAGIVFSPAGKPFVLGDPRLLLNFSSSTAAVQTQTESRPSAFVDDISSLSLPQLEEYSLSLKKMRTDIMKRLQNKDSTPSMNNDFTQGVGVAKDNNSTMATVDYGTHEENMLFGYSDNRNQVLGEDMIRSKNNCNCGEDPSVHVVANSTMEGDQGLGFIEGKETTLAATDEDDYKWIAEMFASADDFMEDPFSIV